MVTRHGPRSSESCRDSHSTSPSSEERRGSVARRRNFLRSVAIGSASADAIDNASMPQPGAPRRRRAVDGTSSPSARAFFETIGSVDHVVPTLSGGAGAGAFRTLSLDGRSSRMRQVLSRHYGRTFRTKLIRSWVKRSSKPSRPHADRRADCRSHCVGRRHRDARPGDLLKLAGNGPRWDRGSRPDADADDDGEQRQPERQRVAIGLVADHFGAAQADRAYDDERSEWELTMFRETRKIVREIRLRGRATIISALSDPLQNSGPGYRLPSPGGLA